MGNANNLLYLIAMCARSAACQCLVMSVLKIVQAAWQQELAEETAKAARLLLLHVVSSHVHTIQGNAGRVLTSQKNEVVSVI